MADGFDLTITVQYQGRVPGSLNLTQRDFNEIIRLAWIRVGKYWIAHFRKRHFTREAYRLYAYSPRKGEPGNEHPKGFWASYSGRKATPPPGGQGHRNPLMWTGDSRERTKQARVHATATSTKSYCRVVLNAPTFNLRNPHSKINMWAEMTRVAPSEWEKLVALHNLYVQQMLDQPGTPQSKTIRPSGVGGGFASAT
jgi:hypothetical protein